VRVFRVVGTERRLGAEHNVEERPRIEGNLPEVWQEALLNAIAHRDYSVQGTGIEVWLFDDRMEVTSPGGLLPELSLDELLSLRRVHCSRNPRLMRTLVDLGLTRDQGEGIPRMFAEMADAFLPSPRIEPTPRSVGVVLRNTTTLGEDDRAFISRIGDEELSDEEFRALLQAHRNIQVNNASLRSLMGLDTLGASQVLRRLRDRRLLELHRAGSQSYYTLEPRLRVADAADRGEHHADRGELGADRGELRSDRGELHADRGELAPSLQQAIAGLGGRPRKERLRQVIGQLCAGHWRTAAWLADQLNIEAGNLSDRHLAPMVRDGTLERRYPETPTHPEQAYRTD
jgi:ATP-dependent DNA helicase RecG